MRDLSKYFISILFILILSGCSGEKTMNNISQIRYYSTSGPVSPEYQWKKEIIINADEVTFTRSGNDPDTLVNEGTWVIEADQDEIHKLFATLEEVDISTIKRINYKVPITGDGYTSICITYENDQTFTITDDSDGKSKNEEYISDPIVSFLQKLDFPE